MTARADTFRRILAAAAGKVYQTHVVDGEQVNQGDRCRARQALYLPADFAGARVLDLGCATGADLFWAVEHGAALAVGIEHGPPQLATLRALIAASPGAPVVALDADLAAAVPDLGPVDVVLCCSICQHLGDRRLWLETRGARVVYVETGYPPAWDAAALNVGGWTAALLGEVPIVHYAAPGYMRRVFRLQRLP